MSTSFYPPNIGYLRTGIAGVPQVSSVFLGRTMSGTYEGIGFGANGRPDPIRVAQINLSKPVGNGPYTQYGTITFNVDDLLAVMASNSHVPSTLNLTLKEVAVCDQGQNKRMIILGSQTYATGSL